MIQLDYPTIFFKMGWFNHQLDGYFCFCKDFFWETILVAAVVLLQAFPRGSFVLGRMAWTQLSQ